MDRIGLPVCERRGDEVLDREAVLAVHHHQRLELPRALEHGQVLVVAHHQHVRVGQEHLEARDALGDHRAHVGERLGICARDRHVEAVVDVRGALGPAHPLLERAAQAVRVHLQCEVDDARRAACGRRLRAGVVVVGAVRAAERHRHVRVVVDRPGQHEAAGRIEHLGVDVREGADAGDGLAVDEHVGGKRLRRVDHGAAADDLPHRDCPLPTRSTA